MQEVLLTFTLIELLRKVLKGIKGVGSVEAFIILAVAYFHFAIMPRSKWPD